MTFVKRIKVSMFSLLTVLSLLTFSCKKGDTGPAGPSGPAGPTGAVGPKGTANVYYSGWVTATNFKDSIVDNSSLHIATVAATQLADSILQKGGLLVYFTFGSGVFPLPYTSYAGGKGSTLSFIPQLNRIIITRFTLDNSNSVALSTVLQYRYIIIPGGTGNRQVDYKSMSYEQVCLALGIPE